ncbi:MAG: glycoside hydrolase family 125 protein [Gemmatimonadetes bacterium]|nr:glycoside hydrolase family 125 protein [Gemmatimonadota bacterium]NNM04961.1 glycoside hydrolase family 125 protein [Gemmatimonadota bacterium]
MGASLLGGSPGSSEARRKPGAPGPRDLQEGPGRSQDFQSRRPPPEERRFHSRAVEETISRVSKDIADPELAWLFGNCFPNTLDTTVDFGTVGGKPDTFVITGDIEAMWLRDSTAQVWPYLPLTPEDPELQQLIRGVIHRQTRCILIDPYANAFNKEAGESPWADDLTDMKPELHERKWEIDSLCYPIRLAYSYWRTTGDESAFDGEWREAMGLTLQTFREQQRKENRGPYKFQRVTGWQTDTVAGAGWGNPIRPVGLIVSIFRPSDDATIFPFLIPSNHFAVVSLLQLAEMIRDIRGEEAFAQECMALAQEVREALFAHGVVPHPVHGEVWAYEVDGFGNRHHMDDANIPSLLSLPYLGACAPDDPLYRRTRAFVLGPENPYYFQGESADGVGGPHVGLEMIWPLGITMRALTSNDDTEIARCLRLLKETHGGTGFMHESFHQDEPERFTREWFAWANTLFGELILKVHRERPQLLTSR